MFRWFRADIAPRISGGFHPDFWTIDVPRATQNYPAIWHGSLAIAAILKSRQDSALNKSLSASDLYEFGLAQYNKSVRQLIGLANEEEPSIESRETLLMATVLFTGLCTMQGDVQTAAMHTRSGLSLFYKWSFWESDKAEGNRILSGASLASIFTTMELQQSFSKPPQIEWYKEVPLNLLEKSVGLFTSLNEAYAEHGLIMNSLIKACRLETTHHMNGTHPVTDGRLRFRYAFNEWRKKFDKLKESGGFTDDELLEVEILELQSIGTEVLLSRDTSKAELGWDAFLPEWKKIVKLSRPILEAKASGSEGPTLAFAPLVFTPLHGCIAACRDPIVRGEALELLKNCPHMESTVKYQSMASIFEAVIALEEYHWAEDETTRGCECVPNEFVCGDHRVIYRHLEQTEPGKGELTLTTVGDIKEKRRGTVVAVSW